MKKHLRFLFFVDSGLIILGLILCFVLPKKYTAEAVFVRVGMEMEQTSLLTTLLGTQSTVPSVSLLDIPNILTTRWVLDRVIDRCNLMEYYHKDKREDLYKLLQDKIKAKVKPDGMVILSYRDRNPEKAYEICSEILKVLDEFHREVRFSYYSDYITFLEKARKDLEKEMKKIEDSLSEFLKTYNIWLDDEGVKTLFELVPDELRKKIVEKELEYRIARIKSGEDSPMAKELKKESELLQRQWEELVREGISKEKMVIFPALKDLGELYVTFSRLLVEQTVRSEVYGFVMQEYYQALVKRNKERSFIEVIDSPRVPETPSFPNKKLILLTFLLLAIIFDTLYLEFKRK